MRNANDGVKMTGYWKVYGDKEKAEKTFAKYRRCTEIYRKQAVAGTPLEQLIV